MPGPEGVPVPGVTGMGLAVGEPGPDVGVEDRLDVVIVI
jgi:hypothetical protein